MSDAKHETVDDIVAEMREIADNPECVVPTGLRYMADRLEAALNREKPAIEMDAEKSINPEAKPLRVCDVNTLESLSDFIVKTVPSSDHLKSAQVCFRKLVEASIITALKVAYEPANVAKK